ncbi:Putative RNA-directed DNA polymerase from transposon BS, partial [Durusdinium trenchii]
MYIEPNTFDLELLCNRFMLAWGCTSYELAVVTRIRQTYGTHCGAIALGHLLLALGHETTCDEERYVTWHRLLLLHQNRFGNGPPDAAMIESLSQILVQNGVPDRLARDRAMLAVKKLGHSAIQQALGTPDPWRALKQIQPANGRPFQLVLYNELQSHIAERASSKRGADFGKKGGKSGRKSLPELHLCPEHLELLPDLFVDSAGDSVEVIGVKEVVSDARGIAIVSPDMAKQLDEESANLSIDALAVLTVGDHSNALDKHEKKVIQHPVIYRPTKEPALLTGTLLQLGDVGVLLKPTHGAPVVQSLDTAVVRAQVFRDAYPLEDWSAFVAGPVKALVSSVESLEYCNGLFDLLSHSGWNGVFIEPRPLPNAPSSQRFAVVWLPRTATIDDAFNWKRNLDQIVGLARMRHKLGLRVRAKDEEATIKAVFPDSCVRPCTVKHTYEAGPLPFGLHRGKVADLLKAWSWKARRKALAKPYVQAASKTLQKMHSTATSSSTSHSEPHDSWATGDDPWKAAAWSRYQPITDQVVFTENRGRAAHDARSKLSTLTSKVTELEQKMEQTQDGDAEMAGLQSAGLTSEIQEM